MDLFVGGLFGVLLAFAFVATIYASVDGFWGWATLYLAVAGGLFYGAKLYIGCWPWGC